MLNKLKFQSIITKYFLGEKVTAAIWNIKDNKLTIEFTTPAKEILGKITCNEFDLKDSKLAIYNTKQLKDLIAIMGAEVTLSLEGRDKSYTKLNIGDESFNISYALADLMVIPKINFETALKNNPTKWEVTIDLTVEDIANMIKGKNASGVEDMRVTTKEGLIEDYITEIIFGENNHHSNKVIYKIDSVTTEGGIELPFNSDIFKEIINNNKDMDSGKMWVSKLGMMKLEFKSEELETLYYIPRMAEL